ncbi:MAG: hypothetical protein ACK4WJ_04205 [Endomicrobiia bacterium]
MRQKYLYYRYKYKEKKMKKWVSKILVFFIIIFFIYFSFLTLPTIKNFLKIDQVEIIYNNTTLSNSLISEFFLNNKVSFFNFRKILKEFFDTYNEVEEVKTNFFPFKKLQLGIKNKIPLFYIVEDKRNIFISKKGEKFLIYDEGKINFAKIIEIGFKNNFDIQKLVYLYNFLLSKNLLSEIKKIEIKDNNEYILYFASGNKVVLDYTFDKANSELLFDALILALNKRKDLYARLLDEGIVYIK